MRGKILQSTNFAPDLQIISIDGQLYLLRKDEVVDASLTAGDVLKQEDIDRILSFSVKHTGPTPKVLVFDLTGAAIEFVDETSLEQDPLYRQFPETKNPWQGIPAASGKAQGSVAIWNHQDSNDLRDKILVASHLPIKDSDVLKRISGLILENGSLLSHISILARENKIPCVIGMKGATVTLKGKSISMDGDSGLIKAL